MEILKTILLVSLPSLILVFTVYYMMNHFIKYVFHQSDTEIQKESLKQVLPHRLQAYERLALYLERIKPTGIARRAETISMSKKKFEYFLIKSIQDEWEHNLSQQIYINPETWKIVFSAKNATQNFVRQCSDDLEENATADDLQAHIIKKSIQEKSPSDSALLKLQVDIQGKSSI